MVEVKMRRPREARMTEQPTALTRHDLETKIVKRCWVDEGFCKEFTADPMGTAVKHLQVPGASLPKIVVHQEAPGTWCIILPAKPAGANELSEKDLERVAGGSAETLYILAVVTISGSVSGISAGVAAGVTITLHEGW
jgi:hypothetical protein